MPGTKNLTSKIAQWVSGQIASANAIYLGLCAANNLDTVNLTAVEPSASTYARVQLSSGNSNPSAQNNAFYGGAITYDEDGVTAICKNARTVYFNTNQNPSDKTDIQSWGTMHYALFFSAASGGQLLAYAELPTDIVVSSSQHVVPMVLLGDLKIIIGVPADEE